MLPDHQDLLGTTRPVVTARRLYIREDDHLFCFDGARRRTVINSVLDSLRVHLPTLTLQTVLAEIERWRQRGVSCFQSMVDSLQLPSPNVPEKINSFVDLLVPKIGSA